ncbi:hypothetical protein I6N90_15095 [Paenibacillus sp. GSMTC-2017]|uniref:sugar phosphate nucleotidyltransferase n=1 Tax=Paenibacillus sp. GSMTC-2017 TaxID=2794350 RepID=UPI0018D89643|nr:sugar phosphate nucleotidyltransferase [Paenibacillus sp. GSMTC-2017]MBH5319132.1 hypothetical protein [Paenibacillus sp. GSMTC-2017]
MKIILLSGGSGRRVWPLSDNSIPKQYLSVLDGPEGKPESMIERLWRQLGNADLLEGTSIATCTDQVGFIKRQLGNNVPLLVEPMQRGTFSTAALMGAYLYTVAGVSLNETIIVLPVDIYVEANFYHCIRSLPKLLRESDSELMMVGTKATHPSQQYGYISPINDSESIETSSYDWKVKGYHEKPCEALAEQFLSEGAMWNSGVYAFSLEFLLSKLTDAKLPVHYEELYKHYNKFPKLSFEEAVISDPTVHKSVTCYEGLWVNLNTWLTISERIGVQ